MNFPFLNQSLVKMGLLVCMSSGLVLSAIDLSGIYTASVKENRPSGVIETDIDSIVVKSEINHGIVTSDVSISFKPGLLQIINSKKFCGGPIANCLENTIDFKAQDSLESNLHFDLGQNAAITELYLWVGNVKVRAELQDRSLASAQYESIVQRRKDPALLETWGNGSYNLRVFPLESNQARKIELKIVQGMEKINQSFAVELPIMKSLRSLYDYTLSVDTTSTKYQSIKYTRLTLLANDGKSYSYASNQLGKGNIGASPITLSKQNLIQLDPIQLTEGTACSNCLQTWTAYRDGIGYFGAKTVLQRKELRLEAEPSDRIVLLDVSNSEKGNLERAKKLALLSLKAYAGTSFKADLGFRDAKGSLRFLFGKPTVMDAQNLLKAYQYLQAMNANQGSDYVDALGTYCFSRGKNAAPSAVIMISDEAGSFEPYLENQSQSEWDAYSKRSELFEKRQQAILDSLGKVLEMHHTQLFGFANSYRIGNLASLTGGYQLGNLNGYTNYYPTPYIEATPLSAPVVKEKMQPIILPALYGFSRPGANLQDLNVTVSGAGSSEAVILWNGYNYCNYCYQRGGALIEMALAKSSASSSSKMIAPWYYNQFDSIPIYISGKYSGSGAIKAEISGKIGGLHFKELRTGNLSSATGAASSGASIWSYQKSEELSQDYAHYGELQIKQIQKLGKDYHVMNRQLSLLALEPGMQLWDSLPNQQTNQTAAVTVSGPRSSDEALVSDKMALGTQLNIDSLSLADILNNEVSGLQESIMQGLVSGLTVQSKGKAILFSLNPSGSKKMTNLKFQILDLQGKQVKQLGSEISGTQINATWNAEAAKPGIYVVNVSGSSVSFSQKFPVH